MMTVLSIDADGQWRYERWRRQWQSGTHSQAIAMVCRFGMAQAQALTAELARPPQTGLKTPPVSNGPAVMQAVAVMLHDQLLHEMGVKRYV